MNWPCCVCGSRVHLHITRNLFGDLHIVCWDCLPAFNKKMSGDEE